MNRVVPEAKAFPASGVRKSESMRLRNSPIVSVPESPVAARALKTGAGYPDTKHIAVVLWQSPAAFCAP